MSNHPWPKDWCTKCFFVQCKDEVTSGCKSYLDVNTSIPEAGKPVIKYTLIIAYTDIGYGSSYIC